MYASYLLTYDTTFRIWPVWGEFAEYKFDQRWLILGNEKVPDKIISLGNFLFSVNRYFIVVACYSVYAYCEN